MNDLEECIRWKIFPAWDFIPFMLKMAGLAAELRSNG
jgi:hypothetical protein